MKLAHGLIKNPCKIVKKKKSATQIKLQEIDRFGRCQETILNLHNINH